MDCLKQCVFVFNLYAFLSFFGRLVVDFHHQISLLYGAVVERCTAASCPTMRAGPQHEYAWTDPQTRQQIFCPASTYINYLMAWVQCELNDETSFPSQIGREILVAAGKPKSACRPSISNEFLAYS